MVERVDGDGYCLFHSVVIGLGRRGEGMIILEELLEAMGTDRDTLVEFVEGPVEEYLMRLKRDGHGDKLEIKYLRDMFKVNIVIWKEDDEYGAATDSEYSSMDGTINISYRNGTHYDAVVPIATTCLEATRKEDRGSIDLLSESGKGDH